MKLLLLPLFNPDYSTEERCIRYKAVFQVTDIIMSYVTFLLQLQFKQRDGSRGYNCD